MSGTGTALLDTTILTNVLLKASKEGAVARAAMARFTNTLLPVYAIKEFKAGPLRNYVWFHNKVVSCERYEDAIAAIPLIFAQKNKMVTAMRALADFESSISKAMPADLARRYPLHSEGQIRKEEATLWLRTLIFRAWRKRRSVATSVVHTLTCYHETDPALQNSGLIDDRPVVCGTADCALRESFRKRLNEINLLIKACDELPVKNETTKRRQALRELHRFPDRPLREADCRSLGDAVFALQCPKGAVVLTTNLVDHQPLASALGVQAVAP